MANDILKPTSIASTTGAWSGNVTNIDEDITAPDGSAITTSSTSSPSITFNISNTVIRDIDTANSVTVKVRAKVNDTIANNETLTVDLLVGGISQGTDAATMTAAYTNHSFTNAGWNQDWTKAQLDSLTIKLTISQTSVNAYTATIDVLNIDVDYTFLAPFIEEPGVVSLTLAPQSPVRDYVENYKWAYPPAGSAAFSGNTTTQDLSVLLDGAANPALSGKPSYINPTTTTLLPNAGAFGTGWSGFITNVDELIASADGSVILYVRSPDDESSGSLATLSFADTPAEITTQSDVLKITVRVRLRAQPISTWSGSFQATLSVNLSIAGASQGTTTVVLTDQVTFTNQRINLAGWNQDWSVAQINNMQAVLEFASASAVDNLGNSINVAIYIDAVNLEIHHTPQSPLLIRPLAGSTQLSTQTVSIKVDQFVTPAASALEITGQNTAAGQSYEVNTDPDNLQLTGKSYTILVITYRSPGEETLDLVPKLPVRVVSHRAKPGAGALTLAGEAPTLDWVDNHSMQPNADRLRLIGENSIPDETTTATREAATKDFILTGQVPTRDRSDNRWVDVGKGTLLLTGKLSASIDGFIYSMLAGSTALSGQTPVASRGEIKQPGVATALTTTGHAPVLGPLEADLALTGNAPQSGRGAKVGAVDLILTGQPPTADVNGIRRIINGKESLFLAGGVPALRFTSQFSKGSDSRFISLTVEYRIEHIGTPAQDIT